MISRGGPDPLSPPLDPHLRWKGVGGSGEKKEGSADKIA